MNNYVNRHYQTYKKIKKAYQELDAFVKLGEVVEQYRGGKVPVVKSMEYRLTFGNHQKRDRGNYLAMIRKFLEDALVIYGVIKDDNDDYVGPVRDFPSQYKKGVYQAEVYIEIEYITFMDLGART